MGKICSTSQGDLHRVNGMKRLLKRFHYFVGGFCCFLVVLLALAAFTPLTNFLARPLVVSPRPEKSEAILVLSGGVYQNGSLSYFTLERVVQAVILYREGFASKIIFSGGTSMGNSRQSDATAMKDVSLQLGVKESDVLLEERSRDTIENLTYSKKIIDKNGFKKVLLVTSAIHTYRSLQIAKSLGLELIPASPNPFEDYRESPVDRLLLFYFTAREYVAITFHKLRGII